jgi:hypothetical protein
MDIAIGTTRAQNAKRAVLRPPPPLSRCCARRRRAKVRASHARVPRAACRRRSAPLRPALPRTHEQSAPQTRRRCWRDSLRAAAGAARSAQAHTVTAVGARAARAAPRRRRAALGLFPHLRTHLRCAPPRRAHTPATRQRRGPTPRRWGWASRGAQRCGLAAAARKRLLKNVRALRCVTHARARLQHRASFVWCDLPAAALYFVCCARGSAAPCAPDDAV